MGLFGRKKAEERNSPRKLVATLGQEPPSFPAVTMQVLDRLRDPDASSEEVSEALQWDPGLVLRVLRTANSAAFAARQPIRDVQHATTYLGRGQLEQLVLAVAVRDALPQTPARGFDSQRFWRVACERATLASALASKVHPARQAESFTVGILQDLAIPVLANAPVVDYGDVLERWHEDPEANLQTLEEEHFGWSHSTIGSQLAEHWQLPGPLVDGIGKHHDEHATDADVAPAIRLVALLRETEKEHGVDALLDRARSDYGLESDWVREVVDDAGAKSEELAGAFF